MLAMEPQAASKTMMKRSKPKALQQGNCKGPGSLPVHIIHVPLFRLYTCGRVVCIICILYMRCIPYIVHIPKYIHGMYALCTKY